MITELRMKSQVTIPSAVIKSLGLKQGDRFDVVEKDGGIFLEPVVMVPKADLRKMLESEDFQEMVERLPEVRYPEPFMKELERIMTETEELEKQGKVKTYDNVEDALYDLKYGSVIKR